MQRKQIFIGAAVAVIAAVALLLFLIMKSAQFYIVSTNPKNGAATPVNGAVIIRTSKPITNADEIIKSLITEPAVRLDITVENDTVTLYPYNGFSPNNYTVAIASIRHNDQTINDFRLKFTASNIPTDQLTNDQEVALRTGQSDIGDIAVAKYPFLTDITTSQDDFDIDYELTDDLLIKINLHPKNLPPLSDSSGVTTAYYKARDAALAHIRANDIDPKNLTIQFTPRFIDQQYQAQNPPPTTQDDGFTGDGVPPEQL